MTTASHPQIWMFFFSLVQNRCICSRKSDKCVEGHVNLNCLEVLLILDCTLTSAVTISAPWNETFYGFQHCRVELFVHRGHESVHLTYECTLFLVACVHVALLMSLSGRWWMSAGGLLSRMLITPLASQLLTGFFAGLGASTPRRALGKWWEWTLAR